jgi:hypothetical protein
MAGIDNDKLYTYCNSTDKLIALKSIELKELLIIIKKIRKEMII